VDHLAKFQTDCKSWRHPIGADGIETLGASRECGNQQRKAPYAMFNEFSVVLAAIAFALFVP